MNSQPTIIIINGSPRTSSNTMVFADSAKSVIEKAGGTVIVENLAEKDIKHCIGCWSGNDQKCKFPCVVNDDLNEIFRKMIHADGIIFVSGVYWFGISGLLKNVVDRMTSLWNNGTKASLLDNKVVAFMSTSVEEGNVSAMAPLMATSTFLGMHILPYGLIYGNIKQKSDFKDSWGLEFAERCGRNMVSMIKMVKKSNVNWWN